MTAMGPKVSNIRLRRLRSHSKLRDMVRENQLQVSDLVQPLFIHHGSDVKNPISTMPGQFQLSVDQLSDEITEIAQLGIPAVLLFGIPEHKDSTGSSASQDDGVIQQAIAKIKSLQPDLLVISDLCYCEYTDHGHCGVLNDKTGPLDVDNDETLALLVEQAISHARAGVDVIAPSGAMDGMVHAIRTGLDQAGYTHIPIMSYAVKYASGMYGPFREAAQGAPKSGDRSSYQMDPANGREAWREAAQDVHEGADILMVKPAHTYLDVIARVKDRHPEVPMAAYHVSGEYAMIKAACQNGWLDESRVTLEVLTSIKRAGADIIITYASKDAARWLQG